MNDLLQTHYLEVGHGGSIYVTGIKEPYKSEH